MAAAAARVIGYSPRAKALHIHFSRVTPLHSLDADAVLAALTKHAVSLIAISFKNVRFRATDWPRFVNALSACRQLRRLCLHNIVGHPMHTAHIVSIVETHTNLELLDLRSNDLACIQLASILSGISGASHPKLLHLFLCNNNLRSEKSVDDLADLLRLAPTLARLDCSWSHLTPESLNAIATAVSESPTLRTLYLNGNSAEVAVDASFLSIYTGPLYQLVARSRISVISVPVPMALSADLVEDCRTALAAFTDAVIKNPHITSFGFGGLSPVRIDADPEMNVPIPIAQLAQYVASRDCPLSALRISNVQAGAENLAEICGAMKTRTSVRALSLNGVNLTSACLRILQNGLCEGDGAAMMLETLEITGNPALLNKPIARINTALLTAFRTGKNAALRSLEGPVRNPVELDAYMRAHFRCPHIRCLLRIRALAMESFWLSSRSPLWVVKHVAVLLRDR